MPDSLSAGEALALANALEKETRLCMARHAARIKALEARGIKDIDDCIEFGQSLSMLDADMRRIRARLLATGLLNDHLERVDKRARAYRQYYAAE